MRRHGFEKHRSGLYFELDIEKQFAALDLNKDGKVTMEEFLKGLPEKSPHDFELTDYNNDGHHTLEEQMSKLTPAAKDALDESTKHAEQVVADMDHDGDGQVSLEEF